MLKELIRAIYEIAKAIKGKSDNDDKKEYVTWGEFIKYFCPNGIYPIGILKNDGERKFIDINEITIDDRPTREVSFTFLYENDFNAGTFGQVYSAELGDTGDYYPFGFQFGHISQLIEIDGKTYYSCYND